MPKLTRTRQAEADLKRIWRFIALDNKTAATNLLIQMNKRIEQLASFPESGSPRPDIRFGCRMLVIAGYRVLYDYMVETDTVEIVAVVEPYRNLEGIL